MWSRRVLRAAIGLGAAFLAGSPAAADTLELVDGTTVRDCYLRDTGVAVLVWRNLEEVGKSAGQVYPRGQVKSFKIERGPDWDAQPPLPDLSVTYIEFTPKLAGLHGRVNYDRFGRPSIGGPGLPDLGEENFRQPEAIVKNLKLKYTPGEELTLTAHVKNLGFRPAPPFDYVWQVRRSGGTFEDAGKGRCDESLAEMHETTFTLKVPRDERLEAVSFAISPKSPEIATINNLKLAAFHAWPFMFVVSPARIRAWHEHRTAFGTFSFEDYYTWHVDEIMNDLFAASVFPSAPEGIQARVRVDRIVYADDPEEAAAALVQKDGIRYDQGLWIWTDSPEERRTGRIEQAADPNWRNQTEWSLPHELGHQLGLTDWYALDYEGHPDHVMPDNGEKIAHFMRHPIQMMHWHGPQPFGEADAGYLNMTRDKPRGHFGDHYFAIPGEVWLRIVDINGQGVPAARVEVFQRGVIVEPGAAPAEDHGVQYWPVAEDGNFDHPVSRAPVIAGTTDAFGRLRLPNRPVQEVRTLNGFHRRPNPFGNINVVGQRGLLLVRVTQDERPCHYWLEIHQFVTAWFRGQRDACEMVLKTPYGSADSPPPPSAVRAQRVDPEHVRVSWQPAELPPRTYQERVIGYRVYRRISNDGLNDRPWFPVATLGPDARSAIVALADRADDIHWYSRAERYGVTALNDCSVESALAEILLPSEPGGNR